MSLLEDVFLEDEAGEAQELERIIEGDEYDERPRPSTPDSNENSEKEDEAEEDKRHIDPTSAKLKRIVKNPRVILNPARLTGPRGIQVIPEYFSDFKFQGKGHEKEDLDLVLKKLEHWAYRLFPKFEYKDCLKKIETLGHKRPVRVHLTKIRTDQFMSEETVVQRDSSDDEAPQPVEDEFDKLLQQQIELARATPAPGTAKKGFTTTTVEKLVTMPKAASSPSINDEQRERMIRNRQLAEERRLARLQLNNSENRQDNSVNDTGSSTRLEDSTNEKLKEDSRDKKGRKSDIDENDSDTDKNLPKNPVNITMKETFDKNLIEEPEENIARVKSNRSNVIDSSDSEDDALVINEAVSVDVHNSRNYDSDESDTIQHNENVHRNINSDKNDGEIYSDIEHQNGREPVDLINDSKNKQDDEIISSNVVHHFDNERDSKTDDPIKDGVKENIIDTNDVEMNYIHNVNGSRSSNKEELAGLNRPNTSSNNNVPNVEEITTNKEHSEMLQYNDNDTVSQISESLNYLKDVPSESTENTEEFEKVNEITTADVDEIMDVDFSDDF